MEAKGHENNYQLREFCTRWDDWYFKVSTHDDGAWTNGNCSKDTNTNPKPPTAVSSALAHYAWVREVDPSMIEVERKAVV